LIAEGKVTIDSDVFSRLIYIFLDSKRLYQARLVVEKALSVLPSVDGRLRLQLDMFKALCATSNTDLPSVLVSSAQNTSGAASNASAGGQRWKQRLFSDPNGRRPPDVSLENALPQRGELRLGCDLRENIRRLYDEGGE
jgi:hypothetical protein